MFNIDDLVIAEHRDPQVPSQVIFTGNVKLTATAIVVEEALRLHRYDEQVKEGLQYELWKRVYGDLESLAKEVCRVAVKHSNPELAEISQKLLKKVMFPKGKKRKLFRKKTYLGFRIKVEKLQ